MVCCQQPVFAGALAISRVQIRVNPSHQISITAFRQQHLAGSYSRRRDYLSIVCRSAMAEVKDVPSEEVLHIWKTAQAVMFDVDSTLCTDESIDELAAFQGVGEAVAAMTASAMGGTAKFEDALAARLNLMKPSKQIVQDFLQSHPPSITPGIPQLVSLLQARGAKVFLVSGGFRAIIDPVALQLGIPLAHVFANTLLWDDATGAYTGFDPEEFTSRSGGKLSAAKHIKEAFGCSSLVAVGDGATDLEARGPGGADVFVGYGGSVFRAGVAQGADWFVYSIEPLLEALR